MPAELSPRALSSASPSSAARLAVQWQRDSARSSPSTPNSSHLHRPQLERGLMKDESLFERHPFTVVSTDFISRPTVASSSSTRRPSW
jgi:hypothetical protein